ncbi:YlcI/YnfO family protein [Corynebacterium sp. AOP40-9SA-29]|uniref:YlcI/YnfO family protein n=1 Tax=Corynebacterium sp. AOP40-9SA-29 TaxID=3457677 RepID=UPI00403368AB
MTDDMKKEQEHEFYSRPENQEPQGPPVRRKSKYGAPVPVRFPQPLLDRIRDAAEKDDRSVSSWIRRAAEHELDRETG